MLIKLAFKNTAKSFKDYVIYFLTLTLGVCIFYMFNSIYAQQEIMTLTGTANHSMAALRQILSIISVFAAVILTWTCCWKKRRGMALSAPMQKLTWRL